ncbi:hypothetical protein [Rhodococcus aetherivorans]
MNRPSSLSTLTAGPGERVLEVLDFHVCAGELCATVVLEPVDGCPALECCIPAEQLHIETLSASTKSQVDQDATADNVARHSLFKNDREKGGAHDAPPFLGSQEEVPGAGNRAALVVAAALGFGLLYFLPIGLLELAVSNGWHAAAGVIAVSFLRPNGERVVLGRLGSFLEAAEAIADHTEILTLQHGDVQLVEAVAPIVAKFADGTVLHYRLEVVDQDATL